MDETSIMVDVKNGDLDKASKLYDLYHIPIFNFFLKLTRDRDLSNDLSQSVFLRMLKYRNTYKVDLEFKAWLYQIARNIYRDHLKKKDRIQYSGYKSVEDVQDDSILELEIGNEGEIVLNKALGNLPEDMKEIIILSKYQQLRYCEIAKILGISVPNVKVKVHRALLKLKENYISIEKNKL